MDESGNVVSPRPWSGDDYLNENPLIRPQEMPLEYEDYDSELRDWETEAAAEEGEDTMPIPEEGESVMGDEENEDYLLLARELWQRGVQARNEGNLELANEYFIQARTFAESWENNAVNEVYTVQYRPELRDCLWRIAGFEEIYDNPYLWPKIWRRNRRIIQNPDLIYPGQQLVIPPQ